MNPLDVEASGRALDPGTSSLASVELADIILRRIASGERTSVTWFNHYSAMMSMEFGVRPSGFDVIGIDGVLLQRLVSPQTARTSADLVLPLVLTAQLNLRVAIVGATEASLRRAVEYLRRSVMAPDAEIVAAFSGYGALPTAEELIRSAGTIDLLIVGLGAPAQDSYALDIARAPGGPTVVVTCGGWLDQVWQSNYYPDWAYPLKLNWLVRVAREPRRLWRRYTTDAARAIRMRPALQSWISDAEHLLVPEEVP